MRCLKEFIIENRLKIMVTALHSRVIPPGSVVCFLGFFFPYGSTYFTN